MLLIKKLFVLINLSILTVSFSYGQHTTTVSKVSLQASGLTCSMCSNSINKAIKTLSFVDKIDANIKTSTFDITFKPSTNIDFDKLKKKVEDAGFSVAGFIATVNFSNVQIKPGIPVIIDGNSIQFVNAKDETINGTRVIKILDKGFLPFKEAKKNTFGQQDGKVYHALI